MLRYIFDREYRILIKLHKHYEKCIEEYKVNKSFWYLEEQSVHIGLCKCSKSKFGMFLDKVEWFIYWKEKNNFNIWWHDIPYARASFEFNLETLEWRLNTLKEIIKWKDK